MLGAIIGDIIGSYYEHNPVKEKNISLFNEKCRFTDDTVLNVAVADILLNEKEIAETFRHYYNLAPDAGYGSLFSRWCSGKSENPPKSFGNGSAMRTCPVAYYSEDLAFVLEKAEEIAKVTHNTPEGIKGALAVTQAIFLARKGIDREEIRVNLENRFSYDLSTPISEIRPFYPFEVTCEGSVPQAIRCFLEASDYEDALRNAISLGGDADTQACIAGAIAEAYFKNIPEKFQIFALPRIPLSFRELIGTFYDTYIVQNIF